MTSSQDTSTQWLSFKSGSVIDIGGSNISYTTREAVLAGLSGGQRKDRAFMPTSLLYNDKGMDIWEQVTHHGGYYQVTDEIQLLEQHGQDIARQISAGTVLLDIGCG